MDSFIDMLLEMQHEGFCYFDIIAFPNETQDKMRVITKEEYIEGPLQLTNEILKDLII